VLVLYRRVHRQGQPRGLQSLNNLQKLLLVWSLSE
jgi:hypothetical protein